MRSDRAPFRSRRRVSGGNETMFEPLPESGVRAAPRFSKLPTWPTSEEPPQSWDPAIHVRKQIEHRLDLSQVELFVWNVTRVQSSRIWHSDLERTARQHHLSSNAPASLGGTMGLRMRTSSSPSAFTPMGNQPPRLGHRSPAAPKPSARDCSRAGFNSELGGLGNRDTR